MLIFLLQREIEVAPSQGVELLSQNNFIQCLGKKCLFSLIGTIGITKDIKLINTYQKDDFVVHCGCHGSIFIKIISAILQLQKAKKN